MANTKGRTPSLTIGGLWEHRQSKKVVELLAQNRETGKVQVTKGDGEVTNGNGYTIMTESSLRKNYTLIGVRKEEPKVSEIKEVATDVNETVKEATETSDAKRKSPTLVKLADGRLVRAKIFFGEFVKLDRSVTKGHSIMHWLKTDSAGQQALKDHNATLVDQ